MEYKNNIVTKSEAVIFVNTEIDKLAHLDEEQKIEEMIRLINSDNGRDFTEENMEKTRQEVLPVLKGEAREEVEKSFVNEWDDAIEKGEDAKKLFDAILKFDKVTVLTNQSRESIILTL